MCNCGDSREEYRRAKSPEGGKCITSHGLFQNVDEVDERKREYFR